MSTHILRTNMYLLSFFYQSVFIEVFHVRHDMNSFHWNMYFQQDSTTVGTEYGVNLHVAGSSLESSAVREKILDSADQV